MAIKKIVFLTGWPLSELMRERFHFEDLRTGGREFEVWDLSALVHSQSVQTLKASVSMQDIQITSLGQLSDCLARDSTQAVFIDFVSPLIDLDLKTEAIYRCLGRHSARMFVFEFGAIPDSSDYETVLESKLKKLTHPLRAMDLLVRRGIRFLRRNRLIYPKPERVFSCSRESVDFFLRPLAMGDRYRGAHSLDYDTFLRASRKGQIRALVEGKYAVFTWPNFKTAPDVTIYGRRGISFEDYNHLMNRLFDQIEKSLGLRVVICAHPRTRLEENPFGRPMFLGQTLELTKHCSLFITHASTAVNFAVLFSKPVLFTYTDALAQMPGFPAIPRKMADLLGMQCVHLENEKPNLEELMTWSEERARKYRDYQFTYTSSPEHLEKTNWEILLSQLDQG